MPTTRDKNLSCLEKMLLECPETGKKLAIKNVKSTKKGLVIEVENGESKWRHRIQTEEM